jgi:hypothetical protein
MILLDAIKIMKQAKTTAENISPKLELTWIETFIC